jgi:hypothetical protein
MGVLTGARIHSIELDRAYLLPPLLSLRPPTVTTRLISARAADEGGATTMSGGIPWLTLPAGYLGSGLIGAALIACGFDTNASKVASLALAVFFVFTLWWARRNLLCVFVFFPLPGQLTNGGNMGFIRTWVLLLGMSGLIILFWFLKGGEALRYLVS